ncbi:uncharacterized protein LOC120536315 [Polypterus senegalus]|uniref:uncharacterized protein LOC120536315 n=1 Tax=Polypterus senegalus TaxID=55291 RepID=UPI001964C88D|nr:uncharacterized protein LOC120536315 [Polypterus senegalus]
MKSPLHGLLLYLLYGAFSRSQSTKQVVKKKLGDSFTFPEKIPETVLLTFGPGVSYSTVARIHHFILTNIYEEGFRGHLHVDSANRSLTITDLRLNHTGTYKLEPNPKRYDIEVYAPVSTPEISLVSSEIGSCTFNCSVENGTQVSVSWYKGDILWIKKSPVSLTLKLEETEFNDPFTCVARNDVSAENSTVMAHTICEGSKKESHVIIPAVMAVIALLAVTLLIFYIKRNMEPKEDGTNYNLGKVENDGEDASV